MRDKIITIISNRLPRQCTFTDDSDLTLDLGLCSLDFMIIVAQIEAEFHVILDMQSLLRVKKVRDLIDIVERFSTERS